MRLLDTIKLSVKVAVKPALSDEGLNSLNALLGEWAVAIFADYGSPHDNNETILEVTVNTISDIDSATNRLTLALKMLGEFEDELNRAIRQYKMATTWTRHNSEVRHA